MNPILLFFTVWFGGLGIFCLLLAYVDWRERRAERRLHEPRHQVSWTDIVYPDEGPWR